MLQIWKLPHMVKGTLTFVPPLNAWRIRQRSTGGTDSPQYCYSTWHRCMSALREGGFSLQGAHMAELGPGDTIGLGLAALLYGVGEYCGLDLVPFAEGFDPLPFFDQLLELAVADQGFRRHMLSDSEIQAIRADLHGGIKASRIVGYHAPWSSNSLRKDS